MRSFQVRNVPSLSFLSAHRAPRRIRGPHPSGSLPRSLTSFSSSVQACTGNWFLRGDRCGPAERTRCTRVCPRGCRLAVSWESRRVCALVLEAVTLPCIAVLINRTSSSPHLTSTRADTPLHRHRRVVRPAHGCGYRRRRVHREYLAKRGRG